MKRILYLIAGLATSIVLAAETHDLNSLGIIVGSLDNPFFKSLVQGAVHATHVINPEAKVQTFSSEFDLSRQKTQIEQLIDKHVDLILLVAADPVAIESYVRRAQMAGIRVVAVDVDATGADASVQSDNLQAGLDTCAYLAESIHGKGSFLIQNGPQVSSVQDRVSGCRDALRRYPNIKLLGDDSNGFASTWGGMTAMNADMKRFPQINAVFAINDRQGIGVDIAARKAGLHIEVGAVDGSPDAEKALRNPGNFIVSASQDPFMIGVRGVNIGNDLLHGKTLEKREIKVPVKLITRENVNTYQGWSSVSAH